MPPLQIDFEDGFSGDTVVVRADGRELWREDDVTTNLAASVATIARLEVPAGTQVEVSVPTRHLTATVARAPSTPLTRFAVRLPADPCGSGEPEGRPAQRTT